MILSFPLQKDIRFLHCPLPTDQIDKITLILPKIGDHWG